MKKQNKRKFDFYIFGCDNSVLYVNRNIKYEDAITSTTNHDLILFIVDECYEYYDTNKSEYSDFVDMSYVGIYVHDTQAMQLYTCNVVQQPIVQVNSFRADKRKRNRKEVKKRIETLRRSMRERAKPKKVDLFALTYRMLEPGLAFKHSYKTHKALVLTDENYLYDQMLLERKRGEEEYINEEGCYIHSSFIEDCEHYQLEKNWSFINNG